MKVIKNKKYAGFSIAALIIASSLLYLNPPHFNSTSAKECTEEEISAGSCVSTDGKAQADWTWQVNVQETLTMDITTPTEVEGGKNAQGDIDKFLRNKYTVTVSSNNGNGFTTGMTTKEVSTDLKNTSEIAAHPTLEQSATLPTLEQAAEPCAAADCPTFAANFWGYSLNETTYKNEETPTGTYKPLVGVNKAPITVLTSENNASKSADVYFGAKTDTSKASGTYTGTVVFTTTSETKGTDLPAPSPQGPGSNPTNPSGPSSTPGGITPSISDTGSPQSNVYAYTTSGRTYRSNASTVASTSVGSTEGNQKKQTTASDFVSPLGVNEKIATESNVQHGSIITTILMCVAFLAAGIGIFFFILAKRRNDDEDEDEIQQV